MVVQLVHQKTGLKFIKVFDGILEFFLGRIGATEQTFCGSIVTRIQLR